MNAKACGRVTQFSLNYTPEKFHCMCTLSQNSKTKNHLEKIKLSLNSEKKALWINKKSSNLRQILREIEGHENKSLERETQYPLNYTPKK